MEEEDDQAALNAAIMHSLQQSSGGGGGSVQLVSLIDDSQSDDDLRRAINLSLNQQTTVADKTSSSTVTAIEDSVEFIRQRRLERLSQLSSSTAPSNDSRLT